MSLIAGLLATVASVGVLTGMGFPLPAFAIAMACLGGALGPRLFNLLAIASLGVVPLFTSDYELMSLVVIAGVALSILGQRRVHITRPGLAVVAFVAYLTTTLAWSDVEFRSFGVALAPTLVLLLGAAKWPLSRVSALGALSFAGILQAVMTLAVFVFAAGRVTQHGAYFLPTALCGAIACAGLSMQATGRRREFLWAGATVCLAGVVATETRGMLLGALVGLATLTLLVSLHRGDGGVPDSLRVFKGLSSKAMWKMGVLATMAVAVAVQAAASRFHPRALIEGSAGRFLELRAAWQDIGQAPLVGHGMGHEFRNPIVGSLAEVNYTHNSLAYFALVGGALGAALFIILLWRLIEGATKRSLSIPDLTCAAMVIGLFVYSMTAALQRTLHFNLILATVAGTSSLRRLRRVDSQEREYTSGTAGNGTN